MIIDHRIGMVHIRALLTARDAVKLALKREGHIVSQLRASQITELARQLLDSDRERMLTEARQRILSSARLRAEWERAGLKYEMALNKHQKKTKDTPGEGVSGPPPLA